VIGELVATQAAQAIAHARLEVALERLSDALRDGLKDSDENMREMFGVARADREQFQHDIRESVQGLSALVPDVAASKAWIESDGKIMREDHKKARFVLKGLAWICGVVGVGGLAVETMRAALKSKGWL
jgi:hypothetical protein